MSGKLRADGSYRGYTYAENRTLCPECGREIGATIDRFRGGDPQRWNEWRVVPHRSADRPRCLGSRNVVPAEAVFKRDKRVTQSA